RAGILNEYIQIYALDQTNVPLSTVMVRGAIMGELSLSPESLYWSITDPAKMKTNRSEALLTRRVSIKSNKGEEFTVKSPRSTIQGINLELVPREWKKPAQAGKAEAVEKGYELIAKMNDIPEKTIIGNISLETAGATQSRIKLPVQVFVLQPPQAQQQPRPAIVPPAAQPRI